MRMIPTPRLWALLGLGIPIALLGLVAPGAERLVLLYNIVVLGAFFASGTMGKRFVPIRASRSTDAVLSVRVRNSVHLTIENLSGSPIRFRVRDEAPENCEVGENEFWMSLGPRRIGQKTYTVVPQSRGNWSFRGLFVRYYAPLGLAMIDTQIIEEVPVRVYPNVKAVQEFELLKQAGHLNLMGLRRSKLRGLGTQFESLREYNDDDFRVIDWKASARRGKLVVRNFEQETNQGLVVCVDIGRHMLGEVEGVRKIDHCLDAALLLMHAAEREGDQVGLLLFNDIVHRYIQPRRGTGQIARILEAIYSAMAEPIQPDYAGAFGFLATRWKRRSLIVVFTDAETEDQATDLSIALAQLRRRHLVYVVRVSDPKIREALGNPVFTEQELFDRSSALWYLQDRRKAEVTLKNQRIHSVEAEPQELATELVHAYLRVKQHNLL